MIGKRSGVKLQQDMHVVFTLHYQLSGQEDVLLPGHQQRHHLSLLGAAQYAHQFLLGMAGHIHSIHLYEIIQEQIFTQ